MRVRVVNAASYIPQNVVTSREVVQRVKANSNGITKLINDNMLELVTGIKRRHFMEDCQNASDLAAEAVKRLVEKTGITLDSVDLLVYASASQDVTEPATAHIVQYKLGTKACVMDVKNACNSFINGVQVAEAMLLTGQYKRAIVCVGETPSRVIRWNINNREELKRYMAGYTFGDAGAAILLEPAYDGSGIFYREFQAKSEYWDMGGVYAGGTMYGRDLDHSFFTGNADRLREIFDVVGPEMMLGALEKNGLTYNDFSRMFVHQVTMKFLNIFISKTCIPRHKIELTLPDYGNMAAASMPVAFSLAEERGAIQRGDKLMFAGIAGGISLGLMMLEY